MRGLLGKRTTDPCKLLQEPATSANTTSGPAATHVGTHHCSAFLPATDCQPSFPVSFKVEAKDQTDPSTPLILAETGHEVVEVAH